MNKIRGHYPRPGNRMGKHVIGCNDHFFNQCVIDSALVENTRFSLRTLELFIVAVWPTAVWPRTACPGVYTQEPGSVPRVYKPDGTSHGL